MGKKFLITLIVLLVLLGLFIWITRRVSVQDMSMGFADSNTQPIPADLEGRRLVWGSNANVPVELVWGGEGHNLLGLMGIPENLQPIEINIGRTPISDEWNIATLIIGSPGESLVPTFLTENNGSFLNIRQSATGEIIVATHHVGESQNVIILEGDFSNFEEISPTQHLDRWPSVTADGNTVLFNSYRGENPYGDLYMAERQNENAEWEVWRKTANTTGEFTLPYIDPGGQFHIAVTQNLDLDMKVGRIILVDFSGLRSIRPSIIHPIMDFRQYKHPTMSENAEILCWGVESGGVFYIYTWTVENGEQLVGPEGGHPNDGWGWLQPSISPDGKFISFVDSYKNAGDDRIGIYELETGIVTYFEGCGGNIMFPSLSDPMM